MIDARNTRCSAQTLPATKGGQGTACTNEAKYLSVGLFVSHKPPFVIMEGRVRNFCPACLYVSMTMALSKVVHPEFYRKDDENEDETDVDSVWVVTERADYLQFCIQEVVAYMTKYDPDGLETLNAKIVEDSLRDSQ